MLISLPIKSFMLSGRSRILIQCWPKEGSGILHGRTFVGLGMWLGNTSTCLVCKVTELESQPWGRHFKEDITEQES